MGSLIQLADLIGRHAPGDGLHESPVPGLSLARSSAPTMPMPVVYEPTLCLVAQGRKQVVLSTTSYVYDAAKYLIASVDLPVMGSVIEASDARPYLCFCLQLGMAEMGDMALRYPLADDNGSTPGGLAIHDTTPALLDAAVRLTSLLDTPSDIGELRPLIVREILYRLLTGPGSGLVRQMALADSRLNQIARAIIWIRAHYGEAWQIDEVCKIAGMSRSNFHAHFKAVTSMSPLAFRTLLRLQEGRRLMVSEALDAASAGFCVGYESPSQFSRDYGRAYGLPPAKDAQRLRSTLDGFSA